jgi:hypothetical protein
VAHPIHAAVQAVVVAGEFIIRSNKIFKNSGNRSKSIIKGFVGKGIDLGNIKANKG